MPTKLTTKLADLMLRRHILVQRVATGQVKGLLDKVGALRPKVLGQLTAAMMESKATPPFMSAAQLRKILDSVDVTLRPGLTMAFNTLSEDLTKFAAQEAAFYPNAITQAIKPVLATSATPVVAATGAQVVAAATSEPLQGSLLSKWADKLTETAKQMITGHIRSGYLQGKPTAEIIKDVKGTYDGKFSQGVASVVRSAVNQVSANARELTAKANSDIIDCRWWLSTLDSHTTTMCQIRDRLFYPNQVDASTVGCTDRQLTKQVAGTAYGAGPGKLHFCCRSTETFDIKALSDWPEGLRPALKDDVNGYGTEQVKASTTYFDWVQRQPRHILEDIYGIQRADQILRGVQVPTMFTDKGEMMTIAQLKAANIWLD